MESKVTKESSDGTEQQQAAFLMMQKGQHPGDNTDTETGRSGKVEEMLRKVFSQIWEHAWAWEMEALEMRGLARESGPVVGGERQWSQQLYSSSIEISKAQIPQRVYRCMEPEYSRCSRTHWNGQDMQVL